MKHTPLLIPMVDLIAGIEHDTDCPLGDVTGWRRRPRASAVVQVLVTWPEHVRFAALNSDASYRRVGRARTLRGRRMIARRWGAEVDGDVGI